MKRALSVARDGTRLQTARDVVVLSFDDRYRRRLVLRGVRGTVFLLDLAEAVALRGGDVLVLEDDTTVEVVAAPETLVEITGADEFAPIRIAWHLGNRHFPVQLVGRRLRIRRDHVVEAMVERLGGVLRTIEAPFDPEGGAYAGTPDDRRAHPHHDHTHHDHGH